MKVTEHTKNSGSNPQTQTSTLGSYNPEHFESKWSKFWEEHAVGSPQGEGETFTMLIPPPNVTGSLHMGHGFQLSLMDAMVRHQRLLGKNVLWVVGTDHAGIATQMVVERRLEAEGKKRKDIGREAFTDAVWAWKKSSGDTITCQMRRLGITVDWTDERFTMDEGYNKAVKETFIRLFDDGLIYRGTKLVHWDTVLQTAVSDLEVDNQTRSGNLWYIQYPIDNSEAFITVATTRPETMFGDAAIAVHPDDARYKAFVGCTARIPYTDISIPILTDSSIDPDFGSGAVKITPAHDHFDYSLGLKHQLNMPNILFPDGRLNVPFAPDFHALDRFDARKKLVMYLERDGYMERIEPHTLTVPVGDRSNSIIEPYLTPQWYVATQKLAQRALNKALDESMRIVPEYWVNTYRHWLENPQDWCISRQIWWGHRIPAWYDALGNIYVGRDEADVRLRYGLSTDKVLHQDEDVLDTWFSSGLWPLETLGYYDHTSNFSERYPCDLLITGFDILFFWVARMSMMGLHFTDTVPFKKVLVTGLIRDSHGQKMSKSKGNVIDPLHLIDGVDFDTLLQSRTTGMMQPQMVNSITQITKKEYPQGIPSHGADALRLTFCALFNAGQDIRFDKERLIGFRNFCNKLWNVARLIEHREQSLQATLGDYTVYEAWLIKSFNILLATFTEHMQNCRFDLAVQVLQDWSWQTFCDWYCEMSKVLMDRPVHAAAALYNLIQIFDKLLIVAHPIMPFLTEELGVFTACRLQIKRSSIATTVYPSVENIDHNTDNVDFLCAFITTVRSIRSMLDINPKTLLSVYLPEDIAQKNFLEQEKDMWQALAKIDCIYYTNPTGRTASKPLEDLTIVRVAIDSIDTEKEHIRLSSRVQKLQSEHQKLLEKMQQPHYKDKAPIDIQETDNALFTLQIGHIEQYHRLLKELA